MVIRSMGSLLAYAIFKYWHDLNRWHIGIGSGKHGWHPTISESLGVELFCEELL